MLKIKKQKDRLIEEIKKYEELNAKLIKTVSDLTYVAMMTDVDLDEDESEEKEDEQKV